MLDWTPGLTGQKSWAGWWSEPWLSTPDDEARWGALFAAALLALALPFASEHTDVVWVMVAVFFVVFSGLTALAGYATISDYGVMEPGAKQIRAGSVNQGARVGYVGVRRGK